MTPSSLRSVALAAAFLSGTVLGCPGSPSPTAALAQSLPGGSGKVAPIRRGPDGHLEVVDPTKSVDPAGRGPCAVGTLCVGPGHAYETLAAAAAVARPGDVIEVVAGTYQESVVLKTPKLVVRGIGGRPHFDCAGLRPAWDKACLVLAAAVRYGFEDGSGARNSIRFALGDLEYIGMRHTALRLRCE